MAAPHITPEMYQGMALASLAACAAILERLADKGLLSNDDIGALMREANHVLEQNHHRGDRAAIHARDMLEGLYELVTERASTGQGG